MRGWIWWIRRWSLPDTSTIHDTTPSNEVICSHYWCLCLHRRPPAAGVGGGIWSSINRRAGLQARQKIFRRYTMTDAMKPASREIVIILIRFATHTSTRPYDILQQTLRILKGYPHLMFRYRILLKPERPKCKLLNPHLMLRILCTNCFILSLTIS